MHQAIPYSGGRGTKLGGAAIAPASFELRRFTPRDGAARSNNGETGGIKSLVAENPVLIVSLGGCCMCHAVKRLLQGLGVNPVVCELDQDKDEQAVMEELRRWEAASPPQLPAVFIGGRFLGGLDRLMAAHISGDLVPILKEARALWL